MDGVSFKTLGCFCLTELGHGSNAQGLETTATYDKEEKVFIFNSPTMTSRKFWIGNLGETAQNAVVLAQLLIEEEGKEVNKGVHSFVFQIRDPDNHMPLPGLEIGDCGVKLSLNGIDNGWMMFNNFKVPREALLNKFGDVTEEGEYKTDISNDGKRFAASMSALSGGRVIIVRSTSECSLVALTIALRYSAVRKQFGPTGAETRILDYPLQQHRLIPRFAEAVVGYIGANNLVKMWNDNVPKLFNTGNIQTEMIHSLSSNMKGFMTLKSQETIAECRRACGGNGYSYYSLFGHILGQNDVHCTWEGDNYVLRMQTQKYLLKAMKTASEGKKLPPTLDYLALSLFEKPQFTGSFSSIPDLLIFFRETASYLAIKAATKLTTCGLKLNEAFLKFQNFELQRMCQSYNDVYLFETFIDFLKTFTCIKTKAVFEKLLLLHMTSRIQESSIYFSPILGDEKLNEVEEISQGLCEDLRKEVVELTKVFNWGNRLTGALGNEDLQVYKRIIQHVNASSGVTERAEWWKMLYQNK